MNIKAHAIGEKGGIGEEMDRAEERGEEEGHQGRSKEQGREEEKGREGEEKHCKSKFAQGKGRRWQRGKGQGDWSEDSGRTIMHACRKPTN